MYKPLFNQRKALRFRQFSRKGYALFACLGRVVTIGVLSVATQQTAIAASDDNRVADGSAVSTSADTLSTDKEVTLDDLEVTGSRAPLALGQAARMVTVLSREDIQAAPVQSINDLLKYAVGVDVRQRGPLGAQTDIGIRGSSSEQIAILLNGVNICDPQTGHNAFDLPCDLSDIVRIEVLEGPAGRVYGTSSLVGAVNVVTTSSPKLGEAKRGLNLRLEGGSFGYLSAACRLSLPALREGPGEGSVRHDIHCPHQRRRAIDTTGRTLQHFDANDVAHIAWQVEGIVSRLRITDVDAVQQDGNLLTAAASDANVRLGTKGTALTDVNAYGIFQQVVNTLYWRRLNILATQYSDHSRCLPKCKRCT